MKRFTAQYNSVDIANEGLKAVSQLLDLQEKQHIDNLLWSHSGYKPQAYFAMAYTNNAILLKYYVQEKYTKADYYQINDPVYKDSCVEFFIAFNNEAAYYNLEFNRLGTALIGYGTGKNDRIPVQSELIKRVKSYGSMSESSQKGNGLNAWQLTLLIPFALFEHHNITSLVSCESLVNFYKCGDDLPEPHFLSWSNINNPQPNFHLSQFFGKVQFA